MKNRIVVSIAFIAFLLPIYSCNRKTYPPRDEPVKNSAPVSAKEYRKKKAAEGDPHPPKMIVVTDSAAKKTATGKYYYELNGYRYWKNERDGKYYLDGIFSSPKKTSTQ